MKSNQDILNSFERQLKREWATKTATSYVKTVVNLLDFVSNINFSEITYRQVKDFIETLYTKVNGFGNPTEEENTASTINQRITALNKFFRYCNEEQLDGFDEVLHFPHVRDKDKNRRKDEQDSKQMDSKIWKKLLDINEEYFVAHQSDRNIKDRLILHLAMKCGMRRGEIARLENKDITLVDVEEKTMVKIKINNGKKNKFRNVYLPITDYEIINNWIIVKKKNGWDTKYLICTTKNKPIFNEATDRESDLIPNVIAKCSRRANIIKDGKVMEYTPHQLRHGFITHMVGLGIDPKELAQYVGNTEKVLMDVYFHGYSQEKMSSIAMMVS